MSTVLGAGIINPALRVAGITDRPMRTPSTDQSTEVIGILNRMIGGWNCNRLDIFSVAIAAYTFTTSKIIYTIGLSGADFTAAVPQRVVHADIILPGTPAYRTHLRILNNDQWSRVRLQAIPNTIPGSIYPDYNFPLCSLYLVGQPVVGYALELHTWQRIPVFAALTDAVVLPDGYEDALVLNLAVKIAGQFPTQAHMDPDIHRQAGLALQAIESRNAPVPKLRNDAAELGRGNRGESRWWITGGNG